LGDCRETIRLSPDGFRPEFHGGKSEHLFNSHLRAIKNGSG